jgi:hypothetical protein
MVRSAHSIENPVTGHRAKFLKTASETNGELLQIEYIVPNREEPLQYIPLHIQAQTDERFETISGRFFGYQASYKNTPHDDELASTQ